MRTVLIGDFQKTLGSMNVLNYSPVKLDSQINCTKKAEWIVLVFGTDNTLGEVCIIFIKGMVPKKIFTT